MDKQEQIRNRLSEFTKPGVVTILGLVESVDEAAKTIVLKDDQTGVQFFDVRLRPIVDDAAFITVIPKLNTWCLIVRIEDDADWMVLNVGEADKYFIKIGTCEFVMTADGFEMKNGSDSLKDILKLMIEAVEAVIVFQGRNPDYIKLQTATEKLNNLFS